MLLGVKERAENKIKALKVKIVDGKSDVESLASEALPPTQKPMEMPKESLCEEVNEMQKQVQLAGESRKCLGFRMAVLSSQD